MHALNSNREPEVLTMSRDEAARALGISLRNLWTRTQSGEIPCVRVGRRVLYSRQALVEWLERQGLLQRRKQEWPHP